MRRLPQIVSFLLFIALCASAAYWAMQLFKPTVRPVAPLPRVAQAELRPDAAASLFGNRKGNATVASNYQLRGVIFSGSPRNSVAIISADGKPAQAIGVDKEIAPGVTIKEVHRDHVLLSDGGATKRVDLPESANGSDGIAAAQSAPPRTPIPPPVLNQPVPSRAQAAAAAQAAQPVPGLPPVQQVPQAITPQNAPSQPPPVPGAVPPPGTGTVPQTTTAPPTTVVSPAPGVPGAPVVPGTVPVAPPVPGADPQTR